jgi:hypothetical protein
MLLDSLLRTRAKCLNKSDLRGKRVGVESKILQDSLVNPCVFSFANLVCGWFGAQQPIGDSEGAALGTST